MPQTAKQKEAAALLNHHTANFKKHPNGSKWLQLTWAMLIYQDAYQNPDGPLMTAAQAAAELRRSETEGKTFAEHMTPRLHESPALDAMRRVKTPAERDIEAAAGCTDPDTHPDRVAVRGGTEWPYRSG